MRGSCALGSKDNFHLLAVLMTVFGGCADDPPGGGVDSGAADSNQVDASVTPDAGATDRGTVDDGGGDPDSGNGTDGGLPVDGGGFPDGGWMPPDAGVPDLECDLSGVLQLSAEELQVCALTSTGTVTCWGSGSNFGRATDYYPAVVPNMPSGVTKVAAGFQHACVLTDAGEVHCWGDNRDGQLGNGTFTATTSPIVVGLSTSAVDLTSGTSHSCALMSTGTVECWGYNEWGQLGNGMQDDVSEIPVEVVGLSGVDAIAAGQYHTCALISGQMKCWGYNQSGRLGDQTATNRPTPVDVIGLPGPVASIWPGPYHTCALLETGSLYCWGYNHAGQLGDGTQETSLVPIQVGGPNIEQLGLGNGHTCARKTDGSVVCWGEDNHGKLGNGRETWGRSLTATVALPRPAVDLVVGNQNSCVLLDDGSIHCWGWSEHGENGMGPAHSTVAHQIPGVFGAVKTALGAYHTCALDALGDVYCWGAATFTGDPEGYGSNGAPIHVGLPEPMIELKAGSYHTCGKSSSGALYCWGANGYGQLGDGNDVIIQLSPVVASALGSAVRDFDGGWGHTCVSLLDGAAKCMGGYNNWGQLGDGTNNDSVTPVDVVSMGVAFDEVHLGAYHSCATGTAADSLYCWGNNQGGQLGPRTLDTSYPERVVGLPMGIDQVEVSTFETCVLATDDSIVCHGAGSIPRPFPVVSGNVSQLAGGEGHLCVLLETGHVQCFGENSLGQAGNGTTDPVTTWQTVNLPRPAVHIETGGQHSCATLDDGTVYCWGRGGQGQLTARFGGYPSPVSCP